MRRHPLTIVVLLVAAVLGLWAGAWYVATQQLIAAIDRWAEARRAEGWQVTYAPPAPAGFPSKVAVDVPVPAVTAPARAAGRIAWDWRASSVRVEIVPWRLDRVVLRTQGEQRLGVARDGERLDSTLDCAAAMVRLEAGLPDDTGHYVVELAQPKLQLAQPAIGAAASQLAVDLRLHRTLPGDHLAIAAVLGFGVTDLVTARLDKIGGAPVTANLHAELLGALPAGPLDRAVAAWRDDGGTVEVRRLYFSVGDINLVANGTLALDNQMRPMGAASAAIRGYDAAIDRLTAVGTVSPRDAQLAKLLLLAIAVPGENGEHVLNVPVTGQDGWLYVGPVRLTRLYPLELK
jgi:hypothetical protein